ncbi:DUF2057 family protein [Pseudoalteromonas pernae]|uniref:DUF2057 family protein n=1 Tax=Pseudoalteromonas pernae TaxID=3118054 RepID=UPI0032422C11
MWKKVTSVAALSLTLMSAAHAEMVSFPAEILPLQVNDKVIEHSFFKSVDELELQPGSYNLKLKYSDLYEAGYDAHEVIESEPFWVTLTVESGKDYQVVFARAKNLDAAKEYAKSPFVSVKVKGKQVARTLPAVAPAVAPVPAVTTAPKEVSAPAPSGVSASAMLEFWWQQASPEERKAFLQKVKN